MSVSASCPDDWELAEFTRGGLAPVDCDRVAEHVEGCPGCQAALDLLDTSTDSLIVSLRQVSEVPPTLDTTIAELPDFDAPAPGDRPIIGGHYKILEQLGEGGMGSVYMAEQSEPIKRLVALKLIKPGMDSRQVLARFEAERQALALMDHPNIARVFDAGTTEAGRPFFAMEMVLGAPITTYCDENCLTLPERLNLFIPVCRAIQHAHQKGVIHRDIKPTNVLVASYDGHPVPKVIDFGIAKAMGPALTERTLVTGFGSVVGTPEYMAPEQAELNQLDVDTRADVYALGILLYELLTGTTPLTRQRLARSAMDEVLRLIREEVPPKPSSRLSEADAPPMIAAARRAEPRRLVTAVRGDLDWVVMKALEKDRARRYETANSLAEDVERFLVLEPVKAGPPSAAYRLSKFARRYRRPLLFGTAVAATLVAVTAFSVRESYRATQAERISSEALVRVREEERRAKEELKTREVVQDFFLNKIVAAGRPQGLEGGLGRDVTLRKAVDVAAAEISQSFRDHPLIDAAIRTELGRSYSLLADYPAAIAQHEEALRLRQLVLEPDDARVLFSKGRLGDAYWRRGRKDEALVLIKEVAERNRAKHGAEHLDTIASLHNLAALYTDIGPLSEAIKINEEVLRLREAMLGTTDAQTLTTAYNLGMSYLLAGRIGESLEMSKKALEGRRATLGTDHVDTFLAMYLLAKVDIVTSQLDESIELLEGAVEGLSAKLGLSHPREWFAEADLATAYTVAGRLEDLIALRERTLPRRRSELGPHNGATLKNIFYLALAYARVGRFAEARATIDDLSRTWSKAGATLDEHELHAMHSDFALAAAQAGHAAEADELAVLALAWQRPQIGPDHPSTLRTIFVIGYTALVAGNPDRARAHFEEYLAGERRRLRPDDPAFSLAQAAVGSAYLTHGRPDDARPILSECLALREKLEPKSWETDNARSLLGACCSRPDEAESLMRDGYEGMKGKRALVPSGALVNLPLAAERLIRFYDTTGNPTEAARWRAERATYPTRIVPPGRE